MTSGGGNQQEIICKGFVVLGITEDDEKINSTAAIRNTNIGAIATAMSNCEPLMDAAKHAMMANVLKNAFGGESKNAAE